MVKLEEINCLKCEMYIKPEDRDCAGCSEVYNESRKGKGKWEA